MNIKITTLIENSSLENPCLTNEHGLSIYIESPEGNILFDTGQSGLFLDNALKLGVNLKNTNHIIFSHAHYDHCGGFKPFVDTIGTSFILHLNSSFFENSQKFHYISPNYKYIGINFNEDYLITNNINLNLVHDNITEILPKIYTITNFLKRTSFEKPSKNMLLYKNSKYISDTFSDETAIVIDTDKGLLVLVGCAHIGIVNILNTISDKFKKKIYGVLGGTHLINADEFRISKTIEYFNKSKIQLIGVSHCTGNTAINEMKKHMSNFFINSTGTTIKI